MHPIWLGLYKLTSSINFARPNLKYLNHYTMKYKVKTQVYIYICFTITYT